MQRTPRPSPPLNDTSPRGAPKALCIDTSDSPVPYAQADDVFDEAPVQSSLSPTIPTVAPTDRRSSTEGCESVMDTSNRRREPSQPNDTNNSTVQQQRQSKHSSRHTAHSKSGNTSPIAASPAIRHALLNMNLKDLSHLSHQSGGMRYQYPSSGVAPTTHGDAKSTYTAGVEVAATSTSRKSSPVHGGGGGGSRRKVGEPSTTPSGHKRASISALAGRIGLSVASASSGASTHVKSPLQSTLLVCVCAEDAEERGGG